MSEQWRGLHNQDDHEWGWGERDAWCTTCEGPRRDRGQCFAKEPCRCCLAAEVEVLRAQVERVRDGVNVVLQRAQGVREFGGRSLDWVSGAEHAAKVITDALDGDDE